MIIKNKIWARLTCQRKNLRFYTVFQNTVFTPAMWVYTTNSDNPILKIFTFSHIIIQKNLLRICFLISLAGSNQFWKENDSLHLNQRRVNMTKCWPGRDTHSVFWRVSGCWKALQPGYFPLCQVLRGSRHWPSEKENVVSTIHSNKIPFFYIQWLQGLKQAEKQSR